MVSGRVWDPLLPLLDGFRLIVPDLYGCGASRGLTGEAGVDDHVNDLAALCENRGFHDLHLVGHSMGGQIAALLAARLPHRFRTLTLLNPVPVQGLALPPDIRGLFAGAGGRLGALRRILEMACRQLTVADRERLLDDALTIPPAIVRSGFESWSAGFPDANLSAARMPAAVVATDDPFLPAPLLEEAVVRRLPNARLCHLPGPGHYPQVEAPAALAALLRNLLT